MTLETEYAARRRRKVQRQLDQALADSFPASDPVSIVTSGEEEDWGEQLAGAEDVAAAEDAQDSAEVSRD